MEKIEPKSTISDYWAGVRATIAVIMIAIFVIAAIIGMHKMVTNDNALMKEREQVKSEAEYKISSVMDGYWTALENPENSIADSVMALRQKAFDCLFEEKNALPDKRYLYWMKELERADSTFLSVRKEMK